MSMAPRIRSDLDYLSGKLGIAQQKLSYPNNIHKKMKSLHSTFKTINMACKACSKVPGFGTYAGRFNMAVKPLTRAIGRGEKCAKKVKDVAEPSRKRVANAKGKVDKIRKYDDKAVAACDKASEAKAKVQDLMKYCDQLSGMADAIQAVEDTLWPFKKVFEEVQWAYDNSVGAAKSVPVLGWFVSAVETVGSTINFVIDGIMDACGISAMLDALAKSLNPLEPLIDKLDRMASGLSSCTEGLVPFMAQIDGVTGDSGTTYSVGPDTSSGSGEAAKGYQNDGAGELLCCVVNTRFGLIPGKCKGDTAWYPYGGKEEYIKGSGFRVIEGYLLPKGTKPRGAAHGRQNDGAGDLWCAVAHTRWGTIPAKAKGNECWFPYGGKEHYQRGNFQYVERY